MTSCLQDGVCLGSIIGTNYDGKFRYLVNDLLLNLPGLKPVSIGINKTGRQSRDFPRMVEAGFQSDIYGELCLQHISHHC